MLPIRERMTIRYIIPFGPTSHIMVFVKLCNNAYDSVLVASSVAYTMAKCSARMWPRHRSKMAIEMGCTTAGDYSLWDCTKDCEIMVKGGRRLR